MKPTNKTFVPPKNDLLINGISKYDKFDKLTVLWLDHSDKKNDNIDYWYCSCICSPNSSIVASNMKLLTGQITDCGCVVSNILSNTNISKEVISIAKKIWKREYADGCSFRYFITLCQLPCHYCGSPPGNEQKHKSNGQTFTYNGLDRIDSKRDHSENNIVPCCKFCNWAKLNRSVFEFQSWIIKAYNHCIENSKQVI